jgi:rSAM/selenodomain-associated transferase 2
VRYPKAPEEFMVSVIVPVWNDAACLRDLLDRLGNEPGPLEIIVVDGRSTDGTPEVASRYAGVRLISVPRGRGRQMNAGARAARGETLLFLHCDTLPPRGAIVELPELLRSSGADFGAFRLRFDPPCLLPALLALFTRFALPWTCFGDQGVFVTRQFFLKTGGFPEIPALEEVHWLRRAAREGCMVRSSRTVTTSARRFQRAGQVRQTLRNGWILLRDRLGADPARLAELYQAGPYQGCSMGQEDIHPPRSSPDSASDSLATQSIPADRF